MATRMQQRRGTAAQWTAADPVLGAGEIGWETDTNKFKIGDGVNNWGDLNYFLDAVALGGSIDDYIPLTQKGAANGVATLDGNGKLTSTQVPNIDELAQDAVDAALTAGTGITKSYNDNANTLTISVDTSTIATQSYVNTTVGNIDLSSKQDVVAGVSSTEIGYLDGVTSAIQTQLNAKAASSHTHSLADVTDVTASAAEVNLLDGVTASTTEINYLDGVTSGIQTQLDNKAPLSSPSFTGTVSGITASMVGLGNVNNTSDTDKPISTATQTALDGKLSLSGGTMTGALTLSGAPTQANHAATKAYADSIAEGLHNHPSCVAATSANVDISTALEPGDVVDGVTLAEGNRVLVKAQTNAAQNGIYVVQASGAALRAADFNEPQEVDGGDFVFVTGGTLYDNTGWVQTTTNVVTVGTDPIVFTQFSGAGTYIAGTGIEITGNEIAVDFADVAAASHTHNLANVTDVTATAAEVNVLDGITASTAELNILDGVTATASELNILDGATLTTAELNYVDGVTSAIQTQLDGKAASSHTHPQSDITNLTTDLAAKASLASPTFTGTVVLPSTTSIGNVSSTELGYLDGVTSAIQTQLNSKVSSTSPSFTLPPSNSSVITIHNGSMSVWEEIDGTYFGDMYVSFVGQLPSIGHIVTYSNIPGQSFEIIDINSQVLNQEDAEYWAPATHRIAVTHAISGNSALGSLGVWGYPFTMSYPGTTISSTEIGYLDGVTSAIQTQLSGKANTSDLAAKASLTGAETLTNKTLTNYNVTGQTKEDILTSATGFAGYTYNVMDDGVQYITANSTGNGTINFRGNGSTTMNTFMATNQSVTCVLLVTNGASAFYPTAFQIDGASVTARWQGGTAPTSGNANSIDAYTFTILKTGSATYVLLASQTRFA